ncbi:hypothetical protein ACFFUS_17190 [Vibrio gallaecicus]|uniref:hypothetical protein n=1 Tax=Vibrio gallaecicus TaxID=552386 RepID=UPI00142E5D8A|nr:hypothetical protein [Vibrio gallaecicus]
MNTLLVCHLGEAKVKHQGAELVTKLLALNANVKLKTTELKPNPKTNLAKKTFVELNDHQHRDSKLFDSISKQKKQPQRTLRTEPY